MEFMFLLKKLWEPSNVSGYIFQWKMRRSCCRVLKCERKARLHLRKQEDLGQHIEREQLRNIKTHMENILFTKKERKRNCVQC